MAQATGAMRNHRDRQTRPVLIAFGVILLVTALLGLLLGWSMG